MTSFPPRKTNTESSLRSQLRCTRPFEATSPRGGWGRWKPGATVALDHLFRRELVESADVYGPKTCVDMNMFDRCVIVNVQLFIDHSNGDLPSSKNVVSCWDSRWICFHGQPLLGFDGYDSTETRELFRSYGFVHKRWHLHTSQ